MRPWFGVVVALAAAACGSREVYAPTTTTSAELAGAPSVTYAIPAAAPRGEVRLASYGVTTGDAEGAPRIHIGLAVSNVSDETWIVDAREQHLALAAGASVQADAPEHVVVPPHATRFVDLVFPVELVVGRHGDVPAFDVGWVVHAGKTIVAGTTSFATKPATKR